MFMQVRERLGGAGLVVAIIALVVALGGGAYAASATQSAKKSSAGLTKKQEKQVIALIKANAKSAPSGAAGPQGAAGTPGAKGDKGPQGEKGIQGEKGTDGTNGTNGTPGTNGKSAKVTPVAPAAPECQGLGGTLVEVEPEPAAEVCNGKEGSPWTAGGKLPVGSTETGTWSLNATEEDTEVVAPISFPIRLISELGPGTVHFQGESEFATTCKGEVRFPKADSGNLCVYYRECPGFVCGELENATFEFFTDPSGTEGGGVSGVLMHFGVTGSAHGFGSWAVTG